MYTITVPWDDRLPEGRTAIALIANNGVFDSNPAVISVYRRKGDLPPPGAGPGGYKFGDYWRMGLPLEILVIVVSIPMILVVWPL